MAERDLAQIEDWLFSRHGAPNGFFTLPMIILAHPMNTMHATVYPILMHPLEPY